MEFFWAGFELVLQWAYIGYMFAGVAFGLLLGFLPGLSGVVGLALMLPLTYDMEPLTALVFLLSIYTGGITGGGITAILFNTPGSAANIATTFDGHPMARRGEPERAMGLALMSSFMGGVIGCLALLLLASPLGKFALRFGPGEMFAVVVFGLSVIGSLSSSVLKSLFTGLCGILLGTVGTNITGVTRGTFDMPYLFDGIPLVPTFLGFLALPEVYEQISRPVRLGQMVKSTQNIGRIFSGLWETFRYRTVLLSCSLLGVIVGIVPAAGAAIASLLSYNQTKLFSSSPERYGTGIPEGIVSCETANNASEGGALTTMYVLGIPGSGATAIILGALVLQGWNPGPKLFFEQREIIYASIASLFVQQFVMLFLGTLLAVVASKVVRLPVYFLIPCIVVFMVLGAYAERGLLFDVGVMIFFGGVGIAMQAAKYPIPPLILGFILGSIADVQVTRIYQSYEYFGEIFRSPITCGLLALSVLGVAGSVLRRRRAGAK